MTKYVDNLIGKAIDAKTTPSQKLSIYILCSVLTSAALYLVVRAGIISPELLPAMNYYQCLTVTALILATQGVYRKDFVYV